MKQYEEPKMEVISFDEADIVRTSGMTDGGTDYGGQFNWSDFLG